MPARNPEAAAMALRNMISHWAATDPGRVAAIAANQHFTYAELSNGVVFLHEHFASKGLTAGSVAIVDVLSPVANRLSLLAFRMLGIDVVPIHAQRLIERLADLPGAFLVLSEREVASGRRSAPPGISIPVHLVPEKLIREMSRPRDPTATPIVLRGRQSVFSSGTTGDPKRVVLKNENEHAIFDHHAETLGYGRDTVMQCGAMGPWGIGGFRFPACIWHLGGTVVFEMTRGPRDLQSHGVTHAHFFTAGLGAHLRGLPKDAPRLDHLSITVSGSPVSSSLVAGVTGRITKQLTNLFGSSEVARHQLQRRFDGDPDEMNWFDTVAERAVDVVREDGSSCAPGETGLLQHRLAPNDVDGYADDPVATEKHFRNRCFSGGDLAVRREDGRIKCVGREDDVLNINSHKVPAGPYEARVIKELDVEDACLFVGLDDAGSELLVVCIESEAPVSKEALRTTASWLARKGRVAFSMHQRFPRGTSGTAKVQRRALQQEAFRKIGAHDRAAARA
ncbi:MAG: class I adenylate-forming enzyme family protein [Pseudomonadota bacterium]